MDIPLQRDHGAFCPLSFGLETDFLQEPEGYGSHARGKTKVEVSVMEQKEKETLTKIRCPMCGVEFSTQDELDLHKKDAHPEE